MRSEVQVEDTSMVSRSPNDAADDADECEVDELGRYADFELEGGAVIIYDTRNEEAWIQSQAGRPRDTMA